MNQSYIINLREDSLHRLYNKVVEKESNDTMLGVLFYLVEDPEYTVFVKHKPSKPSLEVINLINLEEYLDDKTIGGTYTNTIEKFYVCSQRRAEFSGDVYCLACGNEACTCDPAPESLIEDKVDEMEALDRACKDEPFYCNKSATSCDDTKSCSRQCQDCYNYITDFADANDRKDASVIGAKMLYTKYIHGRYLDYWETIPPYAINKRLINQLAETDRSFVYLQWKDRPDVCYRVTMYTKEMLMQYYNDIVVIYVLPHSYDRDPNAVAKPFWLASENAQIIINLIVTFTIFGGIFLGFLINSNNAMITATFSILVFLFYNIWVSTYLNKDRGLSNEAYAEKYGK